MPSNSKLITNVDTVQVFALHQKIACITPLIKNKYKCLQFSNLHYQSKKGKIKGQNQNKQQIRHCAFEQPTKQIPA